MNCVNVTVIVRGGMLDHNHIAFCKPGRALDRESWGGLGGRSPPSQGCHVGPDGIGS